MKANIIRAVEQFISRFFSVNSRALSVTVFLLIHFNLSAQQSDLAQNPNPVRESTIARPPESAQPREMEEWIDSGDAQEKVKRLVSLGVEPEEAAELAQASTVHAHWMPIRTGSPQQDAILFIPCILDSAHIYLLANKGEYWHVTDLEKPDCHYDGSVSIEIAPVRSPGIDEILVHHAGAGHGTGISQQDFNVFAVSSEKLRLELEIEEVVNISRPHRFLYERNELVQHSTFVLIPISRSLSRVIEETRSTTLNDKLTVQRRLFRWSASKSRYLPSKFSPVEAASGD